MVVVDASRSMIVVVGARLLWLVLNRGNGDGGCEVATVTMVGVRKRTVVDLRCREW